MKTKMSVEYVIENHKTKKSLYCTKAFGSIEPWHVVGSPAVIENNLFHNLHFTDTDYAAKYAKWASHIIAKFVDGARVEDICIHPDEYFIYEDWNENYHGMYMEEHQLDKWLEETKRK